MAAMTQPGPPEPDHHALRPHLAALKSTPTAWQTLRATQDGAAILMTLAGHAEHEADRILATIYLALGFPQAPGVRDFFFTQLRRVARQENYAALYAILANYAADPTAIAEFVAICRPLTPGDIAVLLRRSLEYSISADGRTPPRQPPMGVPQNEWQAWHSAIKAAILHMLPHPDLQDLLFDMIQRDPDGPVECTLEDIVRNLRSQAPEAARATQLYATAEQAAHEMAARIAATHPAWPNLEDYIAEFDGIASRRLWGWSRAYFMFDTDLQYRQARIVRRMAQFPNPAAVRSALESLLTTRPPVYPKVRDEGDYYQFEPLFWRAIAYHALVTSHWSATDATAFARRLLAAAPTDAEARAQKEAIEVAVRTWPEAEQTRALLAEAETRPDLAAFVREDMSHLRRDAQSGKKISLGRHPYRRSLYGPPPLTP